MDETVTRKVDYMDDKLVQDPGFRRHLLSEICKVGQGVRYAACSAVSMTGMSAAG